MPGLFDGPLQGRIDPETLLLGGGGWEGEDVTRSHRYKVCAQVKEGRGIWAIKEGWIVNGVRVGGPQHPAPDSVTGMSCMYGISGV